MKNFVKWYAVAFFLVSSFTMFAQGGSDETSPQNTSGGGQTVDGEDPSGSINNQLVYLGLAGAVFAFAYYKNSVAKKTA
ncbi:hypothetical protein [Flavobacterium psychrotrophum]|uniref:hypothetical protein n=1 Tax=Flavobacterium psychrotrophum TaxID=2294119 RepID=UPI000E312D0D|nr:hypothetical protein [Flavobacterium psychrotrophum]